MKKSDKHAECILSFTTQTSLSDIKKNLDKIYPSELLSTKIIEVSPNTYQFQEYCTNYIDYRDFISFEFIKAVCCEYFDFKPIQFKLIIDNNELELPKKTYSGKFKKLIKNNDFFNDFLSDWFRYTEIINKDAKLEKPMKLNQDSFNVNYVQKIIRNYKLKKGVNPIFTFPTIKEILSFQSEDDKLKVLDDLVKFQSQSGNYDYDSYMHGIANGLILAQSVMTGQKFKLLDTPVQWLYDTQHDKLIVEDDMIEANIPPSFTPSKGKTILITGGAGFIGSHLARKLSKDNHVIILDNLFTGSKGNIKDLDVEFIRHDVIKEIYLEVDQIYHLACPASPIHYQSNPIKTVKTNVMGTLNMLGLAKRTKARLVFTSTSEIYGNPLQHPQTEQYFGNVNPIGLRSCYDEGKRAAETLCFNYHREHNVDIGVARIFNTYGPQMALNDGRVISNFIVQSLKKDNITIYGDGSQTRSFCYVDDMVDALISLMESGLVGPFNLGNPKEKTVLEVALDVLEKTNNDVSEIKFVDLPSDDPIKRKPDITLAKKHLNWEPKIDYQEGLEKTIEYFSKKVF